jgi:hypothetical protein
MNKSEIEALRQRAKQNGGFTEYSCPQCDDKFWGGFCQCPDNVNYCGKCGKDEKHCKCYGWMDEISVDNLRRSISHYGHEVFSYRVRLAELLGYEKAAKQMVAQIRLHGLPGPRREPTEAEVAEAEAYLAELDAKGELEPFPTLVELEASAATAREILADCPFGSDKWTEETWASIDARLGADRTSIAKADAERRAAASWRASMVDGKFVYENPEHEISDPGRLHRGRHA